MQGQYISYSSRSSTGVPTYASATDFPTQAPDGSVAVALDNHELYIYDLGTMTWTAVSGGGGGSLTMGAFDGQSPSSNGATITGSMLYLQSATDAVPGLVNNAAQTLSGDKTLQGNLTANSANLNANISDIVPLTVTGNSAGDLNNIEIYDSSGDLLLYVDALGGISSSNTDINITANGGSLNLHSQGGQAILQGSSASVIALNSINLTTTRSPIVFNPGNNLALSLDTSGNATFPNNVTANSGVFSASNVDGVALTLNGNSAADFNTLEVYDGTGDLVLYVDPAGNLNGNAGLTINANQGSELVSFFCNLNMNNAQIYNVPSILGNVTDSSGNGSTGPLALATLDYASSSGTVHRGSGAISIVSGMVTKTGSASQLYSGNISIATGVASGTFANSGSISIETGTAGGTQGHITMGGAYLDMSGMQVQNVLDPVSPQDAATKNYVDSNLSTINAINQLTGDVTAGPATGSQSEVATIAVGAVTDTKASLANKPSVAVVATTNQTLSGLPTIDGVATAVNTLVLLTAQTTTSQNGPWQAQSAAWTRPAWYPSGGTSQAFQFITCLVRLGTTYQGSTWRQTAAAPITIDSTATTWAVTPLALDSSTVIGILPNANTTATNANTASTIVARDASGNFSAGAITATSIVNSGALGAGTTTITSTSTQALAIGANGATNPVLTVDGSTTSVASGVSIKGAISGTNPTIMATDSGANCGLNFSTKGTGALNFQTASGTTRLAITATAFTLTPGPLTGNGTHYLFTGASDTSLTASTEVPVINYNLATTRQHLTGALTLQRDYLIEGATDSFVASSTLTDSATIGVTMKSAGTNATVTNVSGMLIQSGSISGTVTNSFGVNVSGSTGATNNAAALYQTGAAANKGVLVRGAASQSGNLQEWQNSSGTALSKIDALGNNLSATSNVAYQIDTPSTGGTVTIANGIGQELINPAGTLATLTINLPSAPVDGQRCHIASTQILTAVTLSGGSNTVNGGVTTLAAAGFSVYMYVTSATTWYRVG